MLLLVSAAAATGNNNDVDVKVTAETSGTSITDANIAQITIADANLLGSDICATQNLDLSIDDNCVTGLTTAEGCPDDNGTGNGLNDGMTNIVQRGEMLLNDTGCGNNDNQAIDLEVEENSLTIGNITQRALQVATVMGNENDVDQATDADAGFVDEEQEGSPNCLTNSELKQLSSLNACVTGNENDADQTLDQDAFDNKLTNSKLFEQAVIISNILGCDNDADQSAEQNAEDNCLTNSLVNEIIAQNEQITGNENVANQFASTTTDCNDLTSSTELQAIGETIRQLGNNNDVDQCVTLDSTDNCATGGIIRQESLVSTND